MKDTTNSITNKGGFLAPWRYRSFRFLWISALFSYGGRWIETTISNWLVLEITNSASSVGLLGALRFVGMLLGPYCGAIADRVNRRKILIAVQSVYGPGALIIMLLFFTNSLEVWHLYIFALIGGTAFTFDFSTRYATAADIVDDKSITTAVSTLLIAVGSTSAIGPLLGGSLLDKIGASGCYALVGGCFLLSFLSLIFMKTKHRPQPKTRESVWQYLTAGLRYVRHDRALLSLMLLAALVNLVVFPYWMTLIPIFARDILMTGVSGYGQLMAAVGLGAIIGSMTTASLPARITKGKILILTILCWPAILIPFALSRLLPLSFVLLVGTGITQGMSMALIQSILLIRSSDEMRGRVSGVRAFAIGTLPLGNFLAGFGTDLWGAPIVLITMSVISILFTGLIVLFTPELRQK